MTVTREQLEAAVAELLALPDVEAAALAVDYVVSRAGRDEAPAGGGSTGAPTG